MILLELFWSFFKIGLFTIGGGYAMIPLIASTIADKGWIAHDVFIDFIGISESTPGPFAVNIATFIGNETAGLSGALFSTLGVILPSFIIILFIAKYFKNIRDNFYVNAAMEGLRPATIGLILSSAFMIFKENIITAVSENEWLFNYRNLIILGIVVTIRLKFKKLHPILLIGISAGVGIAVYYLIP